jgi:tol-pal system protein YbgF
VAKPPEEARGQPAPAQQPAPAAPPPAPASTERAEFDAALGELREGRYPEAIAAWRRFLEAHPNGGLAGDGQYWLGEAYYLSRDYNAAKEAFIALGLNHPQSARLPDALLKLGYIYGEQGDVARARDVLQKLVQVYPNTQAASLAERRLQSLR